MKTLIHLKTLRVAQEPSDVNSYLESSLYHRVSLQVEYGVAGATDDVDCWKILEDMTITIAELNRV